MSGTAPAGGRAGRRCPYCGDPVARGVPRCPACEGDLAPLRRIGDLADRAFNDGLVAAARRDWATARECVAVAVALDPADGDAGVLLGKLRWRHGDRDLAVEAWAAVLRADPGHEGARAALAHADRVRVAARRPQPSRRKQSRADRRRH